MARAGRASQPAEDAGELLKRWRHTVMGLWLFVLSASAAGYGVFRIAG